MKRRGVFAGIMLAVLLVAAAACGGGEQDATTQPTLSGDNSGSVTGDGNVAAVLHEKLTFGSGGKVAEIAVKEGDLVSKGDVLARLDTGSLELAEAQARLALTQAELARQKAERDLANTRDTEGALELALSNTQIAVRTARFNLEETSDLYTWSDIKTAKADVDDAGRYLDELLDQAGLFLPKDAAVDPQSIEEYIFDEDMPKGPGYELWQRELVHAQARLNTAEDRLDAMLAGSDPEEVAIKQMQLEAAEQAEAQAQQDLETLSDDLAIKNLEVALAEESVALARQSLDQAGKDLAAATIVAPFDGMVARVGVEAGEFLSPAAYTETSIVEIIDMSRMELTARVDERDIAAVKTGQTVYITFDALTGARFEGRVAFISPVVREAGAVLFEDEDEEKEYEVKIDFDIPENSPVRDGMSATAEILTAQNE